MNTHATIHVACILAVALTAIPTEAQGLTWTQLAPTTSPWARYFHAMAYDAGRQRVVLFGGGGNSGLFGDTWEWNGTNWTQLAPSTSPSARYNHAMAYDAARQRVVLFGGLGSGFLGDTWDWDGTNWTQLAPSVSPSARTGHAMAYDAARQRVVLFGGVSYSSGTVGDTWEWDGTNWTPFVLSATPSPRSNHAMAYDAGRQRVVLFGGGGLGDTWEWDGSNWIARFSISYPSARGSHSMAYDAVRQRVVLFGGRSGSSNLGDTWEWDGTNWTQLAPSASPSARFSHSMAYDAGRQRVVLFGGSSSSPTFLGDTWINGVPTTLASATAYGAGCGSPPLGFVPNQNGRPLLGQTATATIVDAPTIIAAVAIGGSNQFFGPFPLPVTLAGIGMPGCDLWQSADILGLGTSPLTPSTLSFSLPLPNAVSLLGVHLYIQAYAFAPGVNPLQIIMSNGIDWVFGNV